jgi:hypothetical protein
VKGTEFFVLIPFNVDKPAASYTGTEVKVVFKVIGMFIS